ncbi:MAG: radical SAM protein [bacterium]
MNKLELQKQIIYGPVRSRRLGRSLGVNLLPTSTKVCSLNCAYCQYGWTQKLTNRGADYRDLFPSFQAVALALREAMSGRAHFDYITFSGSGEPTLHPDFPKIVDYVLAMRAYSKRDIRFAILSNSTTCGETAIRNAIEKLDLPILKLDTGNEKAFRSMNHGAPPITLEEIVEGLSLMKDFVIQAMFVQGEINNSTDAEVGSWIAQLKRLNPLKVQIYSLDRGTASDQVERVEPARLREIAKRTKKLTGLTVQVF